MPEGDTIFRAARTLDRALAGATVTRFETQLAQLARVDDDTPVAGRTVERVEAHGKWTHMVFSGDLILLTHMLMSGSWHIYRPGEAWQRPRSQMRIVVETAGFVAVAFLVQVAEFHTGATLEHRRAVSTLGPDLLRSDFDPAEAARRIRAHADLEIGEALLRQSLVAGVGNVFKSEVCFVCGIHPFRRNHTLSAAELDTLLATARQLLRDNAGAVSGLRRTTRSLDPSARLWVYQRTGQPCRRCGVPIESRKQGPDARSTFWCPVCQPPP